MTLVLSQPVEAVAPAEQFMLPHVRAALAELLVKFNKDPSYQRADARTAELLVEQLALQGLGLRLLPTTENPVGDPTQALAEADTREPRRVRYTQRETNWKLRNELRETWPQTRFFFRSSQGVSTIYYLVGDNAPGVQEVEAVALRYEGVKPTGVDCRECIWHSRTGDDGYPELVSYGTDFIKIAAVTEKGQMRGRKDGLTHLCNVFPLAMREQLLN
jgi:hypothetical protein